MRIINFLQKKFANLIRKEKYPVSHIITMPSPKRRIKFVSNYCYRMDQIECLSKFSKLLIFFRSSQIGDFLIKDILFIPVYPLSLYISSFLEKKNPPVCLNGLRHHNSIYLYLLLISQLKPFRSFIRNHALEL